MKKLSPLFLLLSMAAGVVFPSNAEVTVKVNMGDVVTFQSHVGAPDRMLEEGANTFEHMELIGEIYVNAEEYKMTCTNETSGMKYIVEDYLDVYKLNLNPANVNDGDVLDIVVSKSSLDERTYTVHFDNPDAGYVATLTLYDIWDSCDWEPVLESNEEEYFFPDDDGNIALPYEHNRRIRFRADEGYALVCAWNVNETNPHYVPMTPNTYGVIELRVAELNTNDIVQVKTSEFGEFKVRGEGNTIPDIRMEDNTTYEVVPMSEDFISLDYTGQTYTIRSASSSIEKIEITNNGVTEELIGFDGTFAYRYIPNKGDEMVIYTNGILSGINEVTESADSDVIYNLSGVAVQKNATDASLRQLPAGLYIKGGKKIILK